MRNWIALTIALFSLCTSTAFAQDDDDDGDRDSGRYEDPYVAVKLLLNFGGEGSVEVANVEADDDLVLGYGIGVAYMHPLAKIFALGVQLGVLSWNSDGADDVDLDRNLLVDFSLVPQLNFTVPIVELYLSVPIGFTLDFVGEDGSVSAGGIAGGEVGTGVGWHVGGLVGARLALGRSFGLLGELGYLMHSFSHEVEGTVLGASASADVDFTLGQLVFDVGLYF